MGPWVLINARWYKPQLQDAISRPLSPIRAMGTSWAGDTL